MVLAFNLKVRGKEGGVWSTSTAFIPCIRAGRFGRNYCRLMIPNALSDWLVIAQHEKKVKHLHCNATRTTKKANVTLTLKSETVTPSLTWTSNSTKSTPDFPASLKESIEFSSISFNFKCMFMPLPLCPITRNFCCLNGVLTPSEPETRNSWE